MSSPLVPSRAPSHEHLDESDTPSAEVLRSLRDLRNINRWLGGHRAYRRLLAALLPSHPVVIADIGTGTSDNLESLDQRQASRLVGLDFKLHHLLFGRQLASRPVDRIASNALALPLRSSSVDIVTSAHFFHHFSEDENVRILEEALRVARIGVAVTDTRRHLAPLLFVRAVAATPLWGRITREDAPASVLQGYTPGEAAGIAARTTARRWKVVHQIPFRFGLLLWK
ncbi:MAG TPA: methyltransferase domain-containing protein [Thermoanaerobaculia bacterium]|nr:methyltransferase domain-containing protein [Thermoanaerobaculia bacterium]